MNRAFLALITLVAASSATATIPPAQVQAQPLADALFRNVKSINLDQSILSQADRIAIASQLPLELTPAGIMDNICHQPAFPEVSVLSLNGEMQPQVIVFEGNACANGVTGVAAHLFIKQASGVWTPSFNVPATDYWVLPTKTAGWNDVGLLGRSSCIAVWSFDGRGAYKHARNVDQSGKACKP